MRTKTQAEKAGKALLRKMKGKGWKLRVWENLGWHYSVRNGPINVYATRSQGTFHCLLSDSLEKPYGGAGKDPNKAVLHEIKSARKELNSVTRAVLFSEKVME